MKFKCKKNKEVIGYLFCLENNVCLSLDPILKKRNTRGDQRITYSDIILLKIIEGPMLSIITLMHFV